LKQESPEVRPKERKIVVRKTGKTSTINGFQTEQIEILAGGELIEENWVTRNVEMREVEHVMDRVAQGFSKDFGLGTKEAGRFMRNSNPMGSPF